MSSQDYWDKKHGKYATQDWISKPTIFAQQVIGYFPKSGKILELGAGQGQDTIFFTQKGYDVVSTDFSAEAQRLAKQRLPKEVRDKIIFELVDLNNKLPYPPESFDVVYSHLALHYFTRSRTEKLFQEICEVLKPGGVFATLTNTVEDPEIKNFTFLEPDLYLDPEGQQKHYFSTKTMKLSTKNFEVLLLDAEGETYKDEIKTLIRFVGKKIS